MWESFNVNLLYIQGHPVLFMKNSNTVIQMMNKRERKYTNLLLMAKMIIIGPQINQHRPAPTTRTAKGGIMIFQLATRILYHNCPSLEPRPACTWDGKG